MRSAHGSPPPARRTPRRRPGSGIVHLGAAEEPLRAHTRVSRVTSGVGRRRLSASGRGRSAPRPEGMRSPAGMSAQPTAAPAGRSPEADRPKDPEEGIAERPSCVRRRRCGRRPTRPADAMAALSLSSADGAVNASARANTRAASDEESCARGRGGTRLTIGRNVRERTRLSSERVQAATRAVVRPTAV